MMVFASMMIDLPTMMVSSEIVEAHLQVRLRTRHMPPISSAATGATGRVTGTWWSIAGIRPDTGTVVWPWPTARQTRTVRGRRSDC
jgi:hypothetical protein